MFFDLYHAVSGRGSKWSQLVLKHTVEYALTLLGSTSILIDDQTRHDLKVSERQKNKR